MCWQVVDLQGVIGKIADFRTYQICVGQCVDNQFVMVLFWDFHTYLKVWRKLLKISIIAHFHRNNIKIYK